MNFMGMGIPEIGVIMLVAFLVLGPGRSIEMAKSAGKMLGDLRRSFSDVTSAFSIDDLTGTSGPASTAKTVDKADQSASTQDQEQETPPAPLSGPPPGVPMRAELPPPDEPDEEPGLPGTDDNAEPGEKG